MSFAIIICVFVCRDLCLFRAQMGLWGGLHIAYGVVACCAYFLLPYLSCLSVFEFPQIGFVFVVLPDGPNIADLGPSALLQNNKTVLTLCNNVMIFDCRYSCLFRARVSLCGCVARRAWSRLCLALFFIAVLRCVCALDFPHRICVCWS